MSVNLLFLKGLLLLFGGTVFFDFGFELSRVLEVCSGHRLSTRKELAWHSEIKKSWLGNLSRIGFPFREPVHRAHKDRSTDK